MWLPPVVWPRTPPARRESGAVLIPSSVFLLKLDPEARNRMEDPIKQLEMPPLLPAKGHMESCWVSALQDLPLFLVVCNIINSSDGGVMFWIYLEFLLLFESLHFCFMNQIIVQFEFQAQTVYGVFTVFSAEDLGWQQLHDHVQYAVISEGNIFVSIAIICALKTDVSVNLCSCGRPMKSLCLLDGVNSAWFALCNLTDHSWSLLWSAVEVAASFLNSHKQWNNSLNSSDYLGPFADHMIKKVLKLCAVKAVLHICIAAFFSHWT